MFEANLYIAIRSALFESDLAPLSQIFVSKVMNGDTNTLMESGALRFPVAHPITHAREEKCV